MIHANEVKREYSVDVHRYTLRDVDDILAHNHDEYPQYKKEFDEAMDCNPASHPMYVDIEVNNYCNMKCKMCRYGLADYASGKENMPIDVLDKLLEDCKSLKVPSFFLGGGTECLVNPQIKTILRHIRQIGNGIDDVLITNGYSLTEDIIELLLDLKWEKVFISLDACTDDVYRKIRGKDLNIVENNLRLLLKKREERGLNIPVVRVSFCIQPDNEHEVHDFFKKWKDEVEIIDYQDLMDYSCREIKTEFIDTDRNCNAPFSRLFVGWDGEIYPCCTDWGRNISLGNIRDITIEEAWNGKIINELREELLQHKYRDICKNCLLSIN